MRILQLLIALSFLVFIHEFGHLAFARLWKVRVEKFYMFFNPKISLFRFKKFDGKWHFAFLSKNTTEDDEWGKHPESTEWGIGWVPFGGYCAIAGMVDETHTSEQMAKTPPQPWEFRSKNVWQRMTIILGGILVNFVAALIIFGAIFFHWGSNTLPLRNVDRGLYYAELLEQEGFRQGDHILSIDGLEPETTSDIVEWLIIEGKRNVRILRGADTLSLTMSEDLGTRLLRQQNDYQRAENQHARRDPSYEKRPYVLVSEYFPMVIDSVLPGTAAEFAGILPGDSIISVAGVMTGSFHEVQRELAKHPCDSVALGIVRGGEMMEVGMFLNDRCQMGTLAKNKTAYFEVEHTDYGFFGAMKAGVCYGWDMLAKYVKQFRLVFTKEGAQSLGGFGAIGSMFPKEWDWMAFWHMTAFLSLILAFMNFLPIPALDGGYFLFLLFELFTGKQPGDKFLERVNQVGFWLLIALMVLANFNDVIRYFF